VLQKGGSGTVDLLAWLAAVARHSSPSEAVLAG
jgi:hypothetical protein